MQPVWVLSVDLQTKTATFQSGLSDAAKSARGAFTQIKEGSGEMGREVSGNMMEARHGVILLGEEFGIHLPRGVTSFLASIGPVGAAMEAAFPFLAIAVGATILIEHLALMHAAGEKLTADQEKFGTAANNAFNQLDTKLKQSQIRIDELKGDHLAALKLQLDLIDKTSMDELVHSFEELAKEADVVMKGLAGHWYTFGIGSEGAKAALDEFQNKYNHLLSLQTDAGKQDAANLLTGTLKTANDVLKAQQTIAANRKSGDGPTDESHAAEQALALHKASLTVTTSEIAAQQQLVDALNRQVAAGQEIAKTQKNDGVADKLATAKTLSAQASAGAKEATESQTRMGLAAVAADKDTAEKQLAIKRGSIQDRLALDLDFAGREHAVQVASNAALIADLDKLAPSYTKDLAALHDKALEETQRYANAVSALNNKSLEAQNSKDIQTLEQGEREKIKAVTTGGAERVAAINAAIKQEEAAHLTDTDFYRDLLTQRVEAVRQEAEEEAKIKDAAIKQDNEAGAKAAQERVRHDAAMNKIEKPKSSDDGAARAAELQTEYDAKHAELLRELTDSQSMGEAKVAEQQKIYNELDALNKEYQDHMKENAAAQAQAENVAAMQVANSWGQSMLRVAEGHESMAKMARSAFDSIVSHSLEAALMEVAHEKTAQLAHAEAAAAAAWHSMSSIPVVGPVLGAAAAAATFAGAMAFEYGGIVPGVGTGDVVPAMLTPGEGVVPKGVMAGLGDLAKNGGLQGGGTHNTVHMHVNMTASALDADGVDDVFEKHASTIQKHFERTLRRLNK